MTDQPTPQTEADSLWDALRADLIIEAEAHKYSHVPAVIDLHRPRIEAQARTEALDVRPLIESLGEVFRYDREHPVSGGLRWRLDDAFNEWNRLAILAAKADR